MIKKIEILKVANIYYSRANRAYNTETEILGLFSSEEEIKRAIKSLGFDPEEFDYLEEIGDVLDDSYGFVVDNGDDTLVIYWETYDLDEFAPSIIWEDYCEENGL